MKKATIYSFQLINIILLFSPAGCVQKCASYIYCFGRILDVIQLSGVFNDSKTFVDMPTMVAEEKVLASFQALPPMPTREHVSKFVIENFAKWGGEFKRIVPDDWKENPAFIKKLKSVPFDNDQVKHELIQMAISLHDKWKVLARKYDTDVLCKGCVSSSLEFEELFIIGGGRFREIYYWDSYWILKGLLVSQMFSTAKALLRNMLSLVSEFGFVPNGSRIYYLNRSQPPLLTSMIYAYYMHTNDTVFLTPKILSILDSEHSFWREFRSVCLDTNAPSNGTPCGHRLNQYKVGAYYPRPESYKEDLQEANTIQGNNDEETEKMRQKFFSNMASAAESGWDFSSRWLYTEDNQKTPPLISIDIESLIPIDLNSILFRAEGEMSKLHSIVGNEKLAKFYKDAQTVRKVTLLKFLWDPTTRSWHDFNITSKAFSISSKSNLYLSMFSPFWNGLTKNDNDQSSAAETSFLNTHYNFLFNETLHPAGVPMSSFTSGQQWDFPNIFPPFQYSIVSALEDIRDFSKEPQNIEKLIMSIVNRYVSTTYCAWNVTGRGIFFEKYNATQVGRAGGGGEYEVQDGFGWTNGVLLYFIDRFSNKIQLPLKCPNVAYRGGPDEMKFNNVHENDFNHFSVEIFDALFYVCVFILISFSFLMKFRKAPTTSKDYFAIPKTSIEPLKVIATVKESTSPLKDKKIKRQNLTQGKNRKTLD